MQKVDRGGDALWCPICGCLQDSNGVWHIPAGVRTYSVSDAGEVVVCREHMESEYWGKTERQIFEEESSTP